MRDQRFSVLKRGQPLHAPDGELWQVSFAPPPPPFGHLARQHLIEIVEQPYQARLTLIIGAAGSGKTTLAGEWARQATIPVAWYTLDAADNTLPHFVLALHAALQSTIEPIGTRAAQRVSDPSAPDPVQLLEEIVGLDRDVCLILDNCEALTNEECVSFFNECISLPKTRLRMVLVGRNLPTLRLGRLRSQGHIREIGTADLAFTGEEAERLLRAIRPADSRTEAIASIVTIAEGWAAGLVLLGFSVPPGTDDRLTNDVVTRLASRNLDEYIDQEVLTPLPEDLQGFVLATCSLPWMTAGLCDASLIADDSASKLEALIAQFPFCTPDEHHEGRYRYHPLIGGSLQRLAQSLESERVRRDRRRRAATWFVDEGELEGAAELALGAIDGSLTAEAIEPHCRQLADHSDFESLERWLERVPTDVVDASLDLSYWRIIALLGLQRVFGVESMIDDLAPRALGSHDPLQVGRLHLVRGIVAYYAGKDREAAASLSSALDSLPSDACVERLHCQTFLGQLAFRQGRVIDADLAFSSAEAHALRLPLDQQWNWHVIAPGRANAYALRGDLFSAITKYRLILAEIPPYLADAGIDGMLRCRLISLHIERNELDAARREWQIIETLLDERDHAWHREAIVVKARLLLAEGRRDEAEEWASVHLKTLRRLPEKSQLVHLLARIWLERGEYPMVESWLADVAPMEYPWIQTFGDLNYHVLAVTLELLRGQYDQAMVALESMTREAVARRLWAEFIVLSVRRAVAAHRLGRIDESYEILRPALERGARGGFIRSFVVPGFDIVTMFGDLWTEQQEYLPIRRGLYEILARSSQPDSAVLSKREIEVLRLVSEGRTNQQIAHVMYISTNTVRNHLARIGQRLQAGNRQEAVTRARELGLLN